MSRWQGYGELDDGGGEGLDWACTVYLDGLLWERVGTVFTLVLVPLLPYILMWGGDYHGDPASGNPQVDWIPLAVAALCTLPFALLLALSCLGPESQANEDYYFACLHQTGLTLLQAGDGRPPPLGNAGALWLVYYADLGHYPANRRRYSTYSYYERRAAWHTVNTALRAYFRECLLEGVAPVRTNELLTSVLLNAVLLASIALLAVIYATHAGALQAIMHSATIRLPVSVYVAALALVDSLVLLSLRTEARLAAFLRAMQAHLLALSTIPADTPPASPAAPVDNGWG
jgi:hypothetical protein